MIGAGASVPILGPSVELALTSAALVIRARARALAFARRLCS